MSKPCEWLAICFISPHKSFEDFTNCLAILFGARQMVENRKQKQLQREKQKGKQAHLPRPWTQLTVPRPSPPPAVSSSPSCSVASREHAATPPRRQGHLGLPLPSAC